MKAEEIILRAIDTKLRVYEDDFKFDRWETTSLDFIGKGEEINRKFGEYSALRCVHLQVKNFCDTGNAYSFFSQNQN